MHKLVRIYDSRTKTMTAIPEEELGSEAVPVGMPNIGTVWIREDRELHDEHKPDYRHGPFPKEVRNRIEAIAQCFVEVCSQNADKYEDLFRRDDHPLQEIAIYETLMPLYHRFTESVSSVKKKKEIFSLLLTCTAVSLYAVLNTVQYKELTRQEVEEIAEAYRQANAVPRTVKKLICNKTTCVRQAQQFGLVT